MPWWWRVCLWVACAVGILLFLFVYTALIEMVLRTLPPLVNKVLMFAIAYLIVRSLPGGVYGLECWSDLMSFTDFDDKQNLTRLQDIHAVRRINRWLVTIVMREGLEFKSGMDLQDGRRRHPVRRYILLGMPRDKLSTLVNLVREDSNAEIIGFDETAR